MRAVASRAGDAAIDLGRAMAGDQRLAGVQQRHFDSRSARSHTGSACGRRSPAAGRAATAARPCSALATRSAPSAPRAASTPGVLASSARVYGCAGRANTIAFGPCSTIAPEVHHRTSSAMWRDDLQIVRDEEVGDADLLLQVHQQVQHLRLDRHVERRDRLVGDDQLAAAASARARSAMRWRWPPENMCG